MNALEVKFLLELFLWTKTQKHGFVHLPRTFEILISALIRTKNLKAAELLLYELKSSECSNLFSEIIASYAEIWNLERAIVVYEYVKSHQEIVLNVSCYRAFLRRLVQLKKWTTVLRVYTELVSSGLVTSDENYALDYVVQSLCAEEKVLESVSLLKKLRNLGILASCRSLGLIVEAYRKKRDFGDLMKFLKEWNHVPENRVCNCIVSSICRVSGTVEARSFMRSLEDLGFVGDERTLGILVRWSCRERNLKNASIYLSEIYSRMLVPDLETYNSFLGALSKEGLWECLIQILSEMRENGVDISISTYRVILAGLLMKRRFSEIDFVLGEMKDLGFLDSSKEGTSKVFALLGLEDLGVKIKRDNGLHSSDVEFFDSLGNGLFLSADLKILEARLNRIMDESMNPNFDVMIEDECRKSGVEVSLKMVEKAALMGETVSLSTFSTLFQALLKSKPSKIEGALHLLEEIPDLLNHMDHETLNFSLVPLYKKGFTDKMRMMTEVMIQRGLPIKERSFMAVLSTCCREDDLDTFHMLWDSAKSSNDWLPEIKNLGFILRFFIGKEMLDKGFELFEIMSVNNLKLIPSISCIFIKELCDGGFVEVGFALFKEIAMQVPRLLGYPCYEHLMDGFLRKKKFVAAFHVMDLLRENSLQDVSLSASMWETIACILLGFSRQMEKKLNFSSESEVSSSLSKILLDELSKLGKYNLQKLYSGNSLIFPFESILNMVIQHHCRRKNLRQAHKFLSLMIKMDVHIGLLTYSDLLSLSCLIGRVHAVLNLKEQVLRQHEIPPQAIYNILIFHLSKNGNISAVDYILEEMRKRCYDLDQFSYNFLVYGYHRSGDNEKSVESLKNMISMRMEPTNRSLRVAMVYLCQYQRLDEALELFLEIETNAWKHGSVIQTTLIKSLLQSSRVNEAESLLRRLESKDLIPNNANYDVLIEYFCKIKRVDTGINLLNLMLKKGNTHPSERSYVFVLQGLVSIKALNEALDIHTEMLALNMLPNKESNEMLLQGLCGQGRTFDAEKILDVMTRLGQIPSRDACQLVLDQYHQQKNLKRALEFLHKMQGFGILPGFEAHWSLISSFNSSSSVIKKEESNEGKGFLSHLLSQTGLMRRTS